MEKDCAGKRRRPRSPRRRRLSQSCTSRCAACRHQKHEGADALFARKKQHETCQTYRTLLHRFVIRPGADDRLTPCPHLWISGLSLSGSHFPVCYRAETVDESLCERRCTKQRPDPNHVEAFHSVGKVSATG